MSADTSSIQTKRRSPIIALLLSLLVPGLGHLYNAQPRRAVGFFFLASFLLLTLSVICRWLPPFEGTATYLIGLNALLVVQFLIAVDAFKSARRIGVIEMRRYNRWYAYTLVILAIAVSPTLYESPVTTYSIPAASMMPSLQVGDYIGARVDAYDKHGPAYGDMTVFKLPSDGVTDYIKRIVGLPGDRIQIKGGVLHINDDAVKREHLGNTVYEDRFGFVRQFAHYQETLPNGRRHFIFEESDTAPKDNTPVYTVPAGHYFALGDNRDNSKDSRYLKDVGFIPHANLEAKAELIYFSQDGSAGWWEAWRWPQAVRFNRIGSAVQ